MDTKRGLSEWEEHKRYYKCVETKCLFGLKEEEVSGHLECFITGRLVGGSPNLVHLSFAFRGG
jgi:hypothetical protein